MRDLAGLRPPTRANQSITDILDFAIRLLWSGGWTHHLHTEIMENREDDEKLARDLESEEEESEDCAESETCTTEMRRGSG
jgi:hypothetical protein